MRECLPFLSCPSGSIGHPCIFRWGACYFPGFPLKACGNDSGGEHAGMTVVVSMRDIMIKNNKASLHPKCYILFGKKKINMKGDSPWRKITDLILQVNTFT